MPTRSAERNCRVLLLRPSRSLAWLGALALAGTWPSLYKAGPPPAHTGGFGEPTCRACHSDAGLNEPGGELAVVGAPAAYQPGHDYTLEVTLQQAGMLRAGFQLAVRFVDGPAAGKQGGTLMPSDPRTAVVWDTVTRVAYIEHTASGTASTSGAARWTFRWTAPTAAEGARAVVVHVAANAANDDDSPLGDLIYATAVRVPAARR
jgi:hypothetical protein